MSRSHRSKEKSGTYSEVFRDDYMEGTSARTRPMTYSEIMRRRKIKKDAANPVADALGVPHITLARDDAEKDYCIPECHVKLNEDFVSADRKHASDDSQKLRPLKRGHNCTPSKNEELLQDKDSVFQDHKVKLKSIIRSNRAPESENKTHYLRDERNDNLPTHGSDNGSDKQRAKGFFNKEVVCDISREKFKLNRKLVDNEDRQFYQKRKTNEHMRSDAEEFQKRSARDVMREDKFISVKRKDKDEKEKKQKHHNEGDKTRIRSAGKKYDSLAKRVNLMELNHEKSRIKRRRSQSRERDEDKGRNSPLHTPKVRRYSSQYKSEHGKLPSHFKKDVIGKGPSNTEKKRISSNGPSSLYKRNAGSSSGLGGYSPRKRKTDVAAKTPSPSYRSPEKKLAGWDLPPVGKEGKVSSSSIPLHAPYQNLALDAKEFPRGIPVIPTILRPTGISHLTLMSQMHAVDSIQLTQATRPMRRLYVENLPALATEKDLLECINNFFLSCSVNYIQGTQPCINCIINEEKGQALLEFLTPDDASVALSFNGKLFFGSDLKLRRPKDYTEVTTGLPEKALVAVDSVCDTVEDSPYKIFIGGLSGVITSVMLLEIARVFGPVKAYKFQLIGDSSEPCAFLEYLDHSVNSRACAGLNGMKLGGRVVTAVFATPDFVLEENSRKLPFYAVPEHAKPLLQKPTTVLKLVNVLDPEGILSLSDSDLEEMMEDIRLECSRFGVVKSVNFVKPTSTFITKTTNSSVSGYGSEIDCKSYRSMQANESIEPLETQKEFENSDHIVKENKEFHEFVEPEVGINSLPDETGAEKLMTDEICEPPLVDGNIPAEEPSFQEKAVGRTLESINQEHNVSSFKTGIDACSDSMPVTKAVNLLVKEEMVSVEDGANIGSVVGLNLGEIECSTSDEGHKNDTSIDLGKVFEHGSVFVEYKRAEATCMAAHSLHGRQYDGRVVGVGYVDTDLYRTRFFTDKWSLN